MPPAASADASPLRLRLTRSGLHTAFVALFAALGGSMRGFNLLLILAGLMFGMLALQWRFVRRMLIGLEIERLLPGEAFAGGVFPVQFRVRNRRRLMPAWMIRLEDQVLREGILRGGSFGRLHWAGAGQAAGVERASWAERGEAAETEAVGVCSVGRVLPGRSETTHYDCRITRRGVYRFGPVEAISGFPFGLLTASRVFGPAQSLWVYPALLPLRSGWAHWLHGRRLGLATSRRRAGAAEGDFFGLRPWQQGDSLRWIHWRTSARIGEPAVRQFEQQQRQQLAILVDARGTAGNEEAVERAISLAASFVERLTANPTNRLSLAVAGHEIAAVGSSGVGGGDFRRQALRALAEAAATPHPDLIGALRQLVMAGHPDWPVVILSPGAASPQRLSAASSPHDRSDSPGGTPPQQRGAQALVSRLELIWLDVTQADLDRWLLLPAATPNAPPPGIPASSTPASSTPAAANPGASQ